MGGKAPGPNTLGGRVIEMAKATEILKDEHRGIEKMLAALERGIPRLEAGDHSPIPTFEQGVDFLRGFADRCHHHKEEQILFPALAEKGVPVDGGPIGCMLDEHVQGRAYIQAMATAIERHGGGDPGALRDLAAAARGYTQLLRAHIQKEDMVLFRVADQVLGDEAQRAMAGEFDRVEEEVMGVGTHERYHRMLDTLDVA